MPVSFLDLRRQHEEVGVEVGAAVERVLEGGAYILGREVEAFEREWARFCGAGASAGVANGTDALALAPVVEDAAQAHGARLGRRRAGAWGHAAAFSFYPTKNLGAYGDGGAVTSDDARLIERVKELRQGGHPSAMSDGVAGRNSRLDELQAAALRVKLRRLDAWNQRRRRLAGAYRRLLSRGAGRLAL